MSKFDEACHLTSSSVISQNYNETPNTEVHTEEKCESSSFSDFSAGSKRSTDGGAGDVSCQTRRESGSNTDNAHSFSQMSTLNERKEPLAQCSMDKAASRNPITGLGLGGDGVGGVKPKKPNNRRDGNPVTGEGYKPGHDYTNVVPSLNGAKEVINKNRIPPGGYSSGLW